MTDNKLHAPPTIPLPQQRVLTVEQALSLAVQHQEAGHLQQAEMLLRRILQQQPQHAPALHLLGIVAHCAGKTELAAELTGKAIRIDGRKALYHANRGEMCRLLGRIEEAVRHGRRAVELDRKLISAHSNLGIAWFDSEEYEKAEYCQKEALKIDPRFAPALNNMGSILRERKDDAGAVEYYQRAMAAKPGYLEPMNNLGATLVRMEKPEDALKILEKALIQNPRYAEAHCNRAYALNALEMHAEALAGFMTALHMKPDYAEAYIGIARVRERLEDLDAAAAAAQRAVELAPELAEGWSVLGSMHMTRGDPGKSWAAFERALELDPGITSARMGLGNLLLEDGFFTKAEDMFRSAASTASERTGALFSILQTRKIKQGDPLIAEVEAEAQSIGGMPESRQILMHFSLGKLYDDLGETDKAFPHFIEGCKLKRRKLDYHVDEKDRLFAKVAQVFSKSFIEAGRGSGSKSATPVFVLGMPRSGTTLTEQIIASHPDAFGAGEIYDLLKLAGQRGVFPENMQSFAPQQWRDIGQSYVEGLQARNPVAKKITDKMPVNFIHIGLIHLALPEAKIVHVQRNPLDTCLSCFTRLFSHNQNQTYDLYELGHFYRAYARLMDHWRAILPAGSFLDVNYEDLVADTEAQSRRLVSFCGLDWNDACLEPHKTKRSIRTASVTQVRQPLYNTSVERWRKYEKFLGPLIDGLGDTFKP